MADRPTGSPQGDGTPEPTQPIEPAASAVPPPGWRPPARPAGRVRRTWDEVTASTGGRVALGAVAVLATLLVVAVIGLGAALVGGRHGGELAGRGDGYGRDGGRSQMDDGGPMMRGGEGGDDGRRGQDRGRGQDGGRGQGRQQDGPRQGLPQQGLRQGRGGMMGGVNGLDDVLHGEFTTTATGDPVVMVVQVGEVTAYTRAESITVKSADGFEGTYDLTGPYASTRIGLPLEVGAQVRVVAAKDGMRATRLSVLR